MALFDTKDRKTRGTLKEQIAELRAELQATQDNVGLKRERDDLKKEIGDLELRLSKETEAHEKKLREVEHKVGLQQQKVAQDAEIAKERQAAEKRAAVKDAELTVREGNLDAATERLQEQMEFERRENDKNAERVQKTLEQIITMLPKHNINQHVFSGEADERTKRAALGTGSDDN